MRNRLTFEFIDHRLPTLGISRQLYHPNQQIEEKTSEPNSSCKEIQSCDNWPSDYWHNIILMADVMIQSKVNRKIQSPSSFELELPSDLLRLNITHYVFIWYVCNFVFHKKIHLFIFFEKKKEWRENTSHIVLWLE